MQSHPNPSNGLFFGASDGQGSALLQEVSEKQAHALLLKYVLGSVHSSLLLTRSTTKGSGNGFGGKIISGFGGSVTGVLKAEHVKVCSKIPSY